MNNQPTNRDHTPHALVTGGAGFIGSHLTDLLLEQGHRVTVIDDLSTGNPANLDHARANHPDRLAFIEDDLAAAAEAALRHDPPNLIFHLAAAVGVKRVVDDPARCIETNVIHTAELFRHTLTHAPNATVLVASSSEVYGKSDALPFHESNDLTLGPTSAPRWSYAASKIIDEYLALAHHAKHSLNTIVARFFNIVGPRQAGDYGMVLPRFVHAATHHKPITVFGSGEQTRCFCDVRDLTPALITLAANPDAAGQVVNLGSDSPVSINQLASLVRSTLNPDATITHIPYTEAYGEGFEDLLQRRPDLTRAQRLANIRQTLPLEQTIRDIARLQDAAAAQPAP